MNPSIEEINSDYFLTWGWKKRKNNLPGFNFINHKIIKKTNNNSISVVLGAQSAITYYDDTYDPFDWDVSNDTNNDINIKNNNDSNSYIQSEFMPSDDDSDGSIDINDI